MKKPIIRFYFTVVYDCKGEYLALMEEKFINGHRYFYLMDETGQNEFIHENYIYRYKAVGNAIAYHDASAILKLLDELNNDDGPVSDKTYIWAFNELTMVKKDLMDYQWLNETTQIDCRVNCLL